MAMVFIMTNHVVIGKAGDVDTSEDRPSSVSETGVDLFSGKGRFDLVAEVMSSDDIDIHRYGIQYELKQTDWSSSILLDCTDYDLSYHPVFIGYANNRTEQSRSILGTVGVQLGSRWDVDFSARYYDGFTGFQSIWIAEYYRQLSEGIPGFESPDPEGYSLSLATEYNHTAGHTIRLSAECGMDTVTLPPDFTSFIIDLKQIREDRDRYSVTLRSEDIWTPWLKSLNRFSYRDISSRNTRLSLSSAWNVALGNDWTLRLQGGYTEEGVEFEAVYGGAAIEWQFSPGWYASLNADLYSDTGEIPDTALASTEAPALDTCQYGLGIRWVGERSAFKVFSAIYKNNYKALDGENHFLKHLYQDRNWILVQLSYTYQF